MEADDVRVAEDFDESLLHCTPEFDSLLKPGRADKFIVIGAKGVGKTLLLKAKRVLYQREGQAACLPGGNLLDKLIGDPISGRELIAFSTASPLPWTKVWLAAVAVAVFRPSQLQFRGQTIGTGVSGASISNASMPSARAA